MEEWEALDVDDSDLSSFIRPCKRRHSNHDSPPKTLNTCHSQSPHPIPGPAGAVQAAMMQRRALADRTLPTQEFIHLIDESDGDFNTNTWLSALEFVRGLGMMDGDGVAVTPLSSIKKHLNFGMVPHHVLAVIKSCTPNGFGDMMLTIKVIKSYYIIITITIIATFFLYTLINRILQEQLVLPSIVKSSSPRRRDNLGRI